jgi:hypothetical protein
MRVADLFERWACIHVHFEELDHVWPYFLQDHFGRACVALVSALGLATFDSADCLRVAFRLGIAVKTTTGLPVPISVEALNPVEGSPFRGFRLQTVRDSRDGESTSAYTIADEPYDEEYGAPYFAWYGVRRWPSRIHRFAPDLR